MKYEFECTECGNIFDVGINLKELGFIKVFCPSCDSYRTKRKWTIPFFTFKGSGFYSTDNKKSKDNDG